MIIKQQPGILKDSNRKADLANAEDPTDPGFIATNQLHEKEKRRGVMNWILDRIGSCLVTMGSGLMFFGVWLASFVKEAKDE